MSFKHCAAILALATTIAAPASAWAFGGGAPGCSNLPDYERATGALEGLSTCDMSIEQARRIVAAQQGTTSAYQQVPPTPYAHHRHHRLPPQQP